MQSDVIILGAGGAGMMCAIQAGKRGRRVVLIDHSPKVGGKILISGGGRCNFTNLGASSAQYVSENRHFCKSALSRFTPEHFVEMVEGHDIPFHEKKLGQLFCDRSARDIVGLLKNQCDEAGCQFELGCSISEVKREVLDEKIRYTVITDQGPMISEALVIATGGLSIPGLGATDLGYKIARQFGLRVVETAPALDGFIFSEEQLGFFKQLAGISLECEVHAGEVSFRENILFTHRGLSGPAALQASLHWRKGQEIRINLLPSIQVGDWLLQKKKQGSRALAKTLLSELLPTRFAEQFWCQYFPSSASLPLVQVSEEVLRKLSERLHDWRITPAGTVGYSKAEVTRGGVDTDALSSRTMEAKQVPGLYFIGEVVDVTGWLGGYNFQWAWASGWAAGQVV